MTDLLNKQDEEEAHRLGWRVVEVYDTKTKRVVVDIMSSNQQRWSRDALMETISRLARSNVTCAQSTLQSLVARNRKKP